MFTLPLMEQAALTALLTQPHRKYHNVNHVNDCLIELSNYKKSNNVSSRLDTILTYSIWYHDAVYNPYNPPGLNEKQSASLFANYHAESYVGTSNREMVESVILSTTLHIRTLEFYDDNPLLDIATKIMLDIDLAGFGKPRHIFNKNSRNIIDEYYNSNILECLQGRLKFLKKLNERESFYYTDYFKDLYHTNSKNNVEEDISLLETALLNNDTQQFMEAIG